MISLSCIYRTKLKWAICTLPLSRSLLPRIHVCRLTTLEGADCWRPYFLDSKTIERFRKEPGSFSESDVPGFAILSLPMEIRQNSRQVDKKKAPHILLPSATPQIWKHTRDSIECEVLFKHPFDLEGHEKKWKKIIKKVDASLHLKTVLQESRFLFQVRQAVCKCPISFSGSGSDAKNR